jgi:hypothetical protein
MKRLVLSIVLTVAPASFLAGAHAQDSSQPNKRTIANQYHCPKHPEISASWPTKCPKCGTTLVRRRPSRQTTPRKPRAEEMRREIMMNTTINVFDPGAILGARKPLHLTAEQIEKLRAISMTARERAAEVLNGRQRSELSALRRRPDSPRTMAQMRLQMMQRMSASKDATQGGMMRKMKTQGPKSAGDPPAQAADPRPGGSRGAGGAARGMDRGRVSRGGAGANMRDRMRDRFRDHFRDRYRDFYRDRDRDRHFYGYPYTHGYNYYYPYFYPRSYPYYYPPYYGYNYYSPFYNYYPGYYDDDPYDFDEYYGSPDTHLGAQYVDDYGDDEEGFGDDQGFDNDEGFGDDQSFGDQGFGDEGFGDDQGFGDEGFGGDQQFFGYPGFGNEGFGDNQGFGDDQGFRDDQRFRGDERSRGDEGARGDRGSRGGEQGSRGEDRR